MNLVQLKVILIKIAENFKTTPWNISIEGEVEKPIQISMEEILETFISEERIQRLKMC